MGFKRPEVQIFSPRPETVHRRYGLFLFLYVHTVERPRGLIRALMFNPVLTTQGKLPRRGKRRPPGGCASERMKTQRFSYFAGFAARRPAAEGQFRPVSRGGTSCFMQGKTRKTSKKWRSATFSTVSKAGAGSRFGMISVSTLFLRLTS